jgi:autophagy-related protein 11
MTQTLKSRMVQISQYQSHIASVPTTLTALNSALERQSEAFLQILHIHRMGPAYGATLVEIVRRKEYTKVFLSKAKEMAEILQKFRQLEDRRRENYSTEIVKYLPVGLISGLDDTPPYCEISVSNTKDTLPELTKQDIAEFEKTVSTIKAGVNASSTDSISKLQATMTKISSQVDAIPLEFEKILEKSSLVGKWSQLHEDNIRLKRQASHSSNNVPTTALKYEETIRAYESRIKSLEMLLHERYGSESDATRRTLDQER